MKKHDEGYVLVYVTVVLLVFCLVAATILTGALKNLNHQQDAIAQMKDRYVAEGMIEQVMAQWDKITWSEYTEPETPIDATGAKYMGRGKDDAIILSATHGTAVVTCKVDKDGKFTDYKVETVEVDE